MVLQLFAGHSFYGGGAVVAVVLAMKKIPYQFVLVDMAKKQHKSPEHKARHPFGQLPALDDDGFVIYETRAICKYLENKYPGQGVRLAPPLSDIKGQAMYDQMLSVELCDFYRPMLRVAQEVIFKPMFGAETNQANLTDGVNDLGMKLDVYEGILAKQKYIAGNELSLVDLYHLIYAPGLAPAGVDIMTRAERPHVARWWNELISTPTYVKLKAEGYPIEA
ncbi:Glutathione S-transferase [Mycena indigotica]|uniref:glutathione transferase n=1 Tax=Mycena indigotica TaxID=2126181 RepID=A0A8H6SDS9_9AGAR|nr:Glutathione S-transferase [Mycena indigotica]KAF7296910.1 Glutathione S-transferase [Mycena indigotica]